MTTAGTNAGTFLEEVARAGSRREHQPLSWRVTEHPECISRAGLVPSGLEPHGLLLTIQAFEVT